MVYSRGKLYLSRLLVFPLMNCYPIWVVYGFEMFLAGGAVLGVFLLVRDWYRVLRAITRWEDGRT